MTYGENGSGEKFKKLELHSEIWGEWCVTYGENGSISIAFLDGYLLDRVDVRVLRPRPRRLERLGGAVAEPLLHDAQLLGRGRRAELEREPALLVGEAVDPEGGALRLVVDNGTERPAVLLTTLGHLDELA